MKNYKNVIASTKWLKRVILSYTKLDNLLSKLSYALWVGTKWSLFDHLATCCLSGHDPRMGRRISTCLLGCAIIMFCITACDSGSSSADPDPIAEVSSSSVDDENLSSSSVTDKGTSSGGSSVSSSSKNSSSSAKSSPSTDYKSSSSVKSSSSGTSSSSMLIPCSKEGQIVEMMNDDTGKDDWYKCQDGFYILIVRSSSSSVPTSSYINMDSLYNSKYSYGEFVDPRDGQKYRILDTKFGYDGFENMTVFATNLNYGKQIPLNTTVFDDNAPEKYCYDDDPWYCDNGFGGLYSWSEAMGLPKACDSVWTGTTTACPDSIFPGREYDHEWDRLKIQGICPEGWHVMNRQEWGALKGASENDYGFVSKVSGGSNSQGFSALYGGGVSPTEQKSLYIRKSGFYQLPYERDAEVNNSVILDRILLRFDQPAQKTDALSVRCVKNR